MDVALDASVRAIFDGELAAKTVHTGSFYVEMAGSKIAGDVLLSASGSKSTAIFQPSQSLQPSQTYTAVLTTGIENPSGGTLAGEVRWSFETVSNKSGPIAPGVQSTRPADGAKDVELDIVVAVEFDRDMDPSTIDTGTFTLSGPSGPVSADVRYIAGSRSAELDPSQDLEAGARYRATLSAAIASKAGGKLPETTFEFTTAERPRVISRSPGRGEKNVALTAVISVEFDRDLDPSSLPSGITVSANGTTVSGSTSGTGRNIDFRPSSGLEPGAEHTVSLSAQIRGANGVPIAPESWAFETVARPTVVSFSPPNNATGVKRDADIRVTFDRAMDPASIPGNVIVRSSRGAVAGSLGYQPGSTSALFEPDDLLAMGETYTIDVRQGIHDLNGTTLGRDYRSTFETEDGAWKTSLRLTQMFDTPHANPDIAMSANGEATAVWRQSTFAGHRTYGDRFIPGASWQGKQVLDQSWAGDAGAPLVAAAEDGDAIAVWQRQEGNSIYLRANHYDQSSGWKGAIDIARDQNHHIHHKDVQLAMTPDGRALVVWLYEDWFEQKYNIRFRRYHPGSGWSSFGQIFQIDQPNAISSIRLAVDAAGCAVALFIQQDNNGRYRVHGSASRWNQAWSAPIPVDDQDLVARDGRDPVLAIEGGVVVAAWVQDSQHGGVWRDRLWANRFDFATSTWDGPELADDLNESDADDPAVAMSASGSALVVWRQKRGNSPQLPLFGFRSLDSRQPLSQGFGQPILLPVDLRGYGDAKPEDFRLGLDGSGNALVVYRQESKPGEYDVLSRRYRAGTWAAARVIENSNVSAQGPELSMLSDGRAFVIWYAADATSGEIHSNRFE